MTWISNRIIIDKINDLPLTEHQATTINDLSSLYKR